jgi:hypothetical protein
VAPLARCLPAIEPGEGVMFAVSDADIAAIKREFGIGGRDRDPSRRGTGRAGKQV